MLKDISDEELRSMYWEQGLSGKQIAVIAGCSPSAVCLRMKKLGIPARISSDYPPTEAQLNARKAAAIRLSTHPIFSVEASRESGKRNKGRRKRPDYEFGGHEKLRQDGYVKVYSPDHPNCTADGYVMKHILVVEREIGRYLDKNECVHHINHVRDDNRVENLRLMTISEHMSMHMKERYANRRAKEC